MKRNNLLKRLLLSGAIAVVVSLVGTISVAIGLVQFSQTAEPDGQADNLRFDQLQTDEDKLAPLESYQARDGQQLSYRYYTSDAEQALIMLHGSAYHSDYLQPLASYLAENNIANVYTPDFRGHGPNASERGDVAYIGQLEDDISDLVEFVSQRETGSVVLGGHSSGGGTAIRYAGGDQASSVDGYLLLAPYIHYQAPTAAETNDWANVNTPRMAGLSILNFFQITAFNHKDVISFNMPAEVRDGTETLQYSYMLQTSMHPRGDYQQDIASLPDNTQLLIGGKDEVFQPDAYQPLFEEHAPQVTTKSLPETSHFGIVTKDSAHQTVADWMQATSL